MDLGSTFYPPTAYFSSFLKNYIKKEKNRENRRKVFLGLRCALCFQHIIGSRAVVGWGHAGVTLPGLVTDTLWEWITIHLPLVRAV